jgi:hypothetical protein
VRNTQITSAASAGKPAANGSHSVQLNSEAIKVGPVVLDADAAELSAKVFGGFPPAVQPTVNALLSKKAVIAHAVQVHRVVRASPPMIHKATPRYIRAIKVPDPVSAAREVQLLKLYCDTYPGGKSANLTVRSCERLTIRPKDTPLKR